ncbi:MAG TPA: toll/interleukin-1 receptor domain-containing protein, partial [Methylovirgula sp.]|nr:toll/interleukin-1 receptor domain-containing protein [Methylovirgula sp.]
MKGSVFISYRREDSAGFAGRIYDRLVSRLESGRVFFDVDNIEPGLDFVKVLADRVGNCDALVAIIGEEWLTSSNDEHERRLDDPQDFVRIEIEAALQRDIRVIPVLINGARMPRATDLPDPLKPLVRRQAIEISHTRFDSDSERLTRVVQRALDDQAPETVSSGGAAAEPTQAPVAVQQKPPENAPAISLSSEPKRATRGITYALIGIATLLAIVGLGATFIGHRPAKPVIGSNYLAWVDPPLPVNFGDAPTKIQNAYHTAQAPAPDIDAVTHKQDGTTLNLTEAGVDFGFSNDATIKVIGLTAPFKGTVAGLKIGDTRDAVEKMLGKPTDADSFGTVADYGPTLEIWYDAKTNQV